MGISGISVPSLLIILAIVLLIFGTKKFKSMGSDLGGAIKGFKNAMAEDETNDANQKSASDNSAKKEDNA